MKLIIELEALEERHVRENLISMVNRIRRIAESAFIDMQCSLVQHGS